MAKIITYSILIIALLAFGNQAFCQKLDQMSKNDSTHYIQFSGFVIDSDSLIPVPYAGIYNKSRKSGRLADLYGYFSIVAAPGDLIRFTSVSYKDSYLTIPDTITNDKYTMYFMMETDTFLIQPVYIYPWPSKEEFAQAFLEFDIPDDNLERARKNLEHADMRDRMLGTPGDGDVNFKWAMAHHQRQLYHSGQAPPISLMNPFAWSKFIQAWKNGDFKRKK
ncbi:MAG: hypothetical protein HOH13_04085, partial [Crocinitomicaceae bacterium]|nr:hypothetical protein [Crocinitomicaceae bacterium]